MLDIKRILERLYGHGRLTRQEACEVLTAIAENRCDSHQVAAFLSVYNIRPVTIAEFSGFRDAMMALCIPVSFKPDRVIDLCGTGGDGRDTFNISTLSSLVVAGAGAKVAKHGNRSVSSKCGSSNVLEALGVQFSAEPAALKQGMAGANISFLHAPLFHPAMKHVAPVRQAMGVKTFFNMLGPLVNPADPDVQLSGVFNAEVARLYYYLLLESGKDFAVVYDLNGYDEISLTGPVKVYRKGGEQLLTPADFGLGTYRPESLSGGADIAASAHIFKTILEGQGTAAQTDVVLANAGLALSVYFDLNLREGVDAARASLAEGRALDTLQKVIEQPL